MFLRPRLKNPDSPPVISLKPQGSAARSALLSYLTAPFLLKPGEPMPYGHSNFWECWQMAQTLLEFGFAVDVIDWNDNGFVPPKEYALFIDIHGNLERLHPALSKDCVKILHAPGAHWMFGNHAEYARLLQLQNRRGVSLVPRRQASPSSAVDYADYVTYLGNEFTASTYKFSGKKLRRIPISSPVVYDLPQDKKFEQARKSFLWFGSAGMVHKGLDLVLEAFAQMPEYSLTVCGLMEHEKDFERAYQRELRETANIRAAGWMDIQSQAFWEILRTCAAIVYPSCSEGGGGCVIQCMHAGLIPVVSAESSVDVEDFGVVLENCSLEEIKNAVRRVAQTPAEELKTKSEKAWTFARARHTREAFARNYKEFIADVLKGSG